MTDTEPDLYEIQLANLEETSNTCKECAEKMHGAFSTWLNFVSELHVCCQDTTSQAEADFQTFESKEKANEVLRDQQEKLVTKAEETMKKFETQMTEQNTKYKDLMNKYPTGNDLLKQQLTMLAAETGAQILQIGITAAACSASPMAAIGLAGKAASDVKDTVKSSQGIAEAVKKDDTAAPTGESPVVLDPALTRCEPVKNSVNQLKSLLKGGAGGAVDWDFLTGGGSAKGDGTTDKAEPAVNGETASKGPAEEAQPTSDVKTEGTEQAPNTTKVEVKAAPAESATKDKLQLTTIVILLQSEKDGLEAAADEKVSDVGKQLLPLLVSVLDVSSAPAVASLQSFNPNLV